MQETHLRLEQDPETGEDWLVLETALQADVYDAMQQAMETGTAYHTRLDPPPANGWTPPEVSEAVMGQQGNGAKENRAVHSSDAFQLRIETDAELERDFSL